MSQNIFNMYMYIGKKFNKGKISTETISEDRRSIITTLIIIIISAFPVLYQGGIVGGLICSWLYKLSTSMITICLYLGSVQIIDHTGLYMSKPKDYVYR